MNKYLNSFIEMQKTGIEIAFDKMGTFATFKIID
jgi:hypothetical protein